MCPQCGQYVHEGVPAEAFAAREGESDKPGPRGPAGTRDEKAAAATQEEADSKSVAEKAKTEEPPEEGEKDDEKEQEQAPDWSADQATWTECQVGDKSFDAAKYPAGRTAMWTLTSVLEPTQDQRRSHGLDNLLILVMGQSPTTVWIANGPPSRLDCPDAAIATVVNEVVTRGGDLRGWETDNTVRWAVDRVGGSRTLRGARTDRANFHIQDGHAHAFCTSPCGLSAHSIIHSKLPDLGSQPEYAQQIVFHAYRNIVAAARKQGVIGLAVPIIGGDEVRGDLPLALFVRAALAAVNEFGFEERKEVYLCPHSEEALEAVQSVVLGTVQSKRDDDGRKQEMLECASRAFDMPVPSGPDAPAAGAQGYNGILPQHTRGPSPTHTDVPNPEKASRDHGVQSLVRGGPCFHANRRRPLSTADWNFGGCRHLTSPG